MANLSQVLREEISRLARKEVKVAVTKVHKPTVRLKRDMAALKRAVAGLTKENHRLQGLVGSLMKSQPAQEPEAAAKARVTGKGIRSLRRKLSLTQLDFGRLIGVTSQAVVNMEKKNGPLAVRKVTRAAIVAIRGLGARAAKAKLAEMPAVKKAAAKPRPAKA
jgi:DNA-binding XRE family transcriptional regulator